MSTRCTITVTDDQDTFHIYRHSDGYPEGEHGVLAGLDEARSKAWKAPRFEAMDVAAAIVATWKDGPGNIYLTREARLHGDRSYHYEVFAASNGQWLVKCFGCDDDGRLQPAALYYGRVKDWAKSSMAA